MGQILRQPTKAVKEKFDIIIIGGGIYGVSLALEASRHKLRALVLEKGDFGEQTSANSLKILHGGLRYLQTLDLHRFRESVKERSWFVQTFPSLVQKMPFLMPLYGSGLRRPSIFSIALKINDYLPLLFNLQNSGLSLFPKGKVINSEKAEAIFPSIDKRGLVGAALWYDAFMPESQRLIIEILRWACDYGATALNYCEAKELILHNHVVEGVLAYDRESKNLLEFRSSVVVNAAGAWNRNLSAAFHRENPSIFIPSIAWNILFDRDIESDHSLALTPHEKNSQTYFIIPWKGKILAGTGHAFWWSDQKDNIRPTDAQIQKFIKDLNNVLPGYTLSSEDILRIYSGLLPAQEKENFKLASRELIYNFHSFGGPKGLFSITGVKFTTARLVAEKAIKMIFPTRRNAYFHDRDGFSPTISSENFWNIDIDELTDKYKFDDCITLKSLINNESVIHIDDLVLRRTSLWLSPKKCMDNIVLFASLFGWNEPRVAMEKERLKTNFEMNGIISQS